MSNQFSSWTTKVVSQITQTSQPQPQPQQPQQQFDLSNFINHLNTVLIKYNIPPDKEMPIASSGSEPPTIIDSNAERNGIYADFCQNIPSSQIDLDSEAIYKSLSLMDFVMDTDYRILKRWTPDIMQVINYLMENMKKLNYNFSNLFDYYFNILSYIYEDKKQHGKSRFYFNI